MRADEDEVGKRRWGRTFNTREKGGRIELLGWYFQSHSTPLKSHFGSLFSIPEKRRRQEGKEGSKGEETVPVK